MTIPVSIIMAFCDRPTFQNTLIGWSNLDYPDYEFIFMDNGTKKIDEYKKVIDEFGKTHKVKYLCFDKAQNLNVAWNTGYKEASGDFIIFAMQDEIISNKQILYHLLEEYDNRRISLITLYLSPTMTNDMILLDWKNNPEVLETLDNFWREKVVLNFTRTSATVLSHISGQYRKDWDWFGLFRPHETGYLWVEQDVAIRESFLEKPAVTACGVKCYHQAHRMGGSVTFFPSARCGYKYKTEREARLLDPAEGVP